LLCLATPNRAINFFDTGWGKERLADSAKSGIVLHLQVLSLVGFSPCVEKESGESIGSYWQIVRRNEYERVRSSSTYGAAPGIKKDLGSDTEN